MTDERELTPADAAFVRFGADGLVPAVLQDAASRQVLMVGFMNAEALAATRATGLVHFWSRSRARLWRKGETSGNVSRVVETRVNCERNSLLLLVEQAGAICHDGYPTCFYRRVDNEGDLAVVEPRAFDPAEVYGDVAASPRPSPRSDVIVTWFGAYEYLRDHDLAAESSTSRRLRSGEDLRGRVADELGELAGVLDGSHRHGEFRDDITLEAGQVLYWLTLVAVGYRLLDAGPDLTAAILAPGTSSSAGLAGERLVLLALASSWPAVTEADLLALIPVTVAAVARVAALAGVDPVRLIEDDLASLRTRPYLDGYFADRN